jgi:hypothetical protein
MNGDEPDMDGRLAAQVAMAQVSARLAFASFMSNCPAPPRLGTPEHRAMIDGKDATLAMALCGFHAEHKHGRLSHLRPEDMTEIAAVLAGLDIALSRHLGVTVAGEPLS